MKMFRLAGVIAGLLLSLLLAGCGDTYRPVIIPFPTTVPNPKTQTLVVVGNEGFMPGSVHGVPCTTADTCPGSTTDIDVPGDINMANHVVGEGPVGAVLIGAALYTANLNSNNLSTYSPFISGSTPTNISLASANATVPMATVQTKGGSSATVQVGPSFIATKQAGSIFVTMPACASVSSGACTAFDKTTPGVLGIISTSTGVLTQTVQMDLDPVTMVGLVDGTKLYVVNQGDGSTPGTVVVVNAINNNVLSPTTAATAQTPPFFGFQVGRSPVWATATSDSKFVFVLNNGDSSVSVISTANDGAALGTPFSVGAQGSIPTTRSFQNPMVWDSVKQRLYVTNPGADSVSVFDTSNLAATSPTMPLLTTVPLPAGSQPFSIAVLPDGSRAYVLNAGNLATGGTDGPSVSIIDANSFAVSKLSSYFGTDPRGIVASSDGSKVYVPYHEWTTGTLPDGITPAPNPIPPGTAIYKTLDNSTIRDSSGAPFPIAAPFQDPVNCTADVTLPSGEMCVRQRPVFAVAQ